MFCVVYPFAVEASVEESGEKISAHPEAQAM